MSPRASQKLVGKRFVEHSKMNRWPQYTIVGAR
jgi:hypothetical protein